MTPLILPAKIPQYKMSSESNQMPPA